MKNKLRILYGAVLILALFNGCVSLRGAITEQIDSRRVEYALVRHDTAPVVFENGLGATINSWAKVFPEISKDATAFVYNRPGYGKSELASTPRDGLHIADELRLLLRSKDLKPPYILVGHSLGGLYMQLFARRYPDEVKALILVDSTHPEQFKGKGSPQNWPWWVRLAFNIWTSPVEKEEFNAIKATGENVLGLKTFTEKPVIVLSASQPVNEKSELATDAKQKQEDFVRLYPGARQIWVDSGHNIPLEKPDPIISAIREVLSINQSSGFQVQ